MCSCDESPSGNPTCSRCVQRTLIGRPDWRYLSVSDLCDTGEWTEQEAAESRREHALSEVDFKSPFESAA